MKQVTHLLRPLPVLSAVALLLSILPIGSVEAAESIIFNIAYSSNVEGYIEPCG